MNWRKIDEAWKEFAANLGQELQLREKSYLKGKKVNYQIAFIDEFGNTIYSGLVNKSTSGYNLYKMDVKTEILNGLQFEEIEVKRRNRLAKFFFPSHSSTSLLNEQVEKILERTNAERIILQPKLLKMEFDFMPTGMEELDLIDHARIELLRIANRPCSH